MKIARPEIVARVVVNGRPSKEGHANFDKARKMLKQALTSDVWPSEQCMFVIRLGGFIQARMPKYSGSQGWNTRIQDFQGLIPTAQKATDRVLTAEMMRELRSRARFLRTCMAMPPVKPPASNAKASHAVHLAVVRRAGLIEKPAGNATESPPARQAPPCRRSAWPPTTRPPGCRKSVAAWRTKGRWRWCLLGSSPCRANARRQRSAERSPRR